MQIPRRWAIIAGTILVSGALLTGAVFADDGPAAQDTKLESAVKSGKLTRGEADVMKQLGQLRQEYKTRAQSLIDQAVKEGKITQEQADKLKTHGRHHGKHAGKLHERFSKMTQEELKAKLDAAVKDGKLTQEHADKILEHHAQMKQ